MQVEYPTSTLAIIFACIGQLSVLVVIYLQRLKLMKHIQYLKVQNISINKELEAKSSLQSVLSVQTNQKARELTSGALSIIL
jgi:hypothetical protein